MLMVLFYGTLVAHLLVSLITSRPSTYRNMRKKREKREKPPGLLLSLRKNVRTKRTMRTKSGWRMASCQTGRLPTSGL